MRSGSFPAFPVLGAIAPGAALRLALGLLLRLART
jgi:hypothetical protein